MKEPHPVFVSFFLNNVLLLYKNQVRSLGVSKGHLDVSFRFIGYLHDFVDVSMTIYLGEADIHSSAQTLHSCRVSHSCFISKEAASSSLFVDSFSQSSTLVFETLRFGLGRNIELKNRSTIH